jgi:hypothetical protein
MATSTSLERLDEHRKKAARLKEAELVHRMRMAGESYGHIAVALKMGVHKVAQLHREHIEQLRDLEALGALEANRRVQDERYEALLTTVWSRAMNGDMDAIKECRQILDSITARESKVTALITRTDGDSQVTLVAEGSSDDYIRALEAMSG